MVVEEIRIRGTVQGVGFRPTVYRLAKLWNLKGEVRNDGEGVLIRVCGSQESIENFLANLQVESPPLSIIQDISRTICQQEIDFTDFTIVSSVDSQIHTEIAADAATCPQCKQEIFDPFNRYFRYPFTNCTHCGPRFSIIRAIPYDRCNTSMSAFGICDDCAKEYQDVSDRRFHAQPIACHICGPTAWLERSDRQPITASMFSMLDDVDAVCTLLQRGKIVAIKGIGGFHLACDATQETAVNQLRQRKQRYHKPFALMARDMEIIDKYCLVGELEKDILQSAAAPIVLLRKRTDNQAKIPIAASVAPQQNTLGFLLPYTPLHHLILRRMGRPIVFTSGNISDEPQCIDNAEAQEKLGKIADYFLFHNRDIVNRIDDSVVRVNQQQIQVIRRSRGYAPTSIQLPLDFAHSPNILAMGGELKNTFCLLSQGKATLSQHLGDLENHSTWNDYQKTLELYLNLFNHNSQYIAIDKHPEYLSSKLGKELAATQEIPLISIQHHHAHIAACMVENHLPLNTSPVLGIACDGLGYGEDNTLWGGEFILADYRSFQRLARFKPMAMIGGKQAIYQPWRNTYAHLKSIDNWDIICAKYADLEIIDFLKHQPLALLDKLITQSINTPLTSSLGRLFDAVAAAMGICCQASHYEGQAAIAMEALIDIDVWNYREEIGIYPFKFNLLDTIYSIDAQTIWQLLLDDLQQHKPQKLIAAKFHLSLAYAITNMVEILCQKHDIKYVAFSGGVFQNQTLLNLTINYLQHLKITPLTHSLIPSNDGGIALGQAVITAARNIN
ncbi:carbamoyltransferase HypF [Calothrix sp. 336/3]|uniref:carbamoyltransferase HypF n=1 Tax=Calothrix sp. 336/3 TaxID=1337936 RepID=UPI0004E2B5A8|nr:carbamoyltransferase HypF [Calothrix sp. 336/3]AKG23772.1 carbamoyltransferase [Calothrix sp. 336/3]